MVKVKLSCFLIALIVIVIDIAPLNAKPKEIVCELTCSSKPDVHFDNLPCGLFISAKCDATNAQIHNISHLPEKTQKQIRKLVVYQFTPNLEDFFESSFKKYVRQTGIPSGIDRTKDFNLKVRLKEYTVVDEGTSAPCSVVIEWELANSYNQIVLDGVAKGKYTMSPGQSIVDALDKAYGKALEDISWNEIALLMKRKQNNTQTEQTIDKKDDEVDKHADNLNDVVIRWYIISQPSGADVTWRVVSSTTDVKNTNGTYVGTTPYESTESFDIRGLTMSNSGSVQIEVTCEKPGYVTQKKRFNLRQAIDQREISTKFNLVKEE